MNENAIKKHNENVFEISDLEELEKILSQQIEEDLSDLHFLEVERENIAEPEAFGEVIYDSILDEFGKQLGLNATNELLIQKYDRENPKEKGIDGYKNIKDEAMNDKKYKNENKKMKVNFEEGTLEDAYTGETLKRSKGDKPNLDHVVPRKKIFENQRRKQANKSVKDLANLDENLVPTNESLNKSKGAKTNKEYVDKREIREKDLVKQNERKNKKSMDSNKSEVEQRKEIEKNDKRLDDKLSANSEKMLATEKNANKKINRVILKDGTKEVGKKASKDALKMMIITSLTNLLKEIIKGLIRFFKGATKSFQIFLDEMKQSIKSFFESIMSSLKQGTSNFIGTIVSEIFGPILSTFKKAASLIKQGVSSIGAAISWLMDSKNKNKPFTVKVAQIGKIIVAGLSGASAVLLSEVFEKVLLGVPIFVVSIPGLGTLANIIGVFISSIVSGIIGALIINLIDKYIAEKQKEEVTKDLVEKKNEVMNLQKTQQTVATEIIVDKRDFMKDSFEDNRIFANQYTKEVLDDVYRLDTETNTEEIIITENEITLSKLQADLEDLL